MRAGFYFVRLIKGHIEIVWHIVICVLPAQNGKQGCIRSLPLLDELHKTSRGLSKIFREITFQTFVSGSCDGLHA